MPGVLLHAKRIIERSLATTVLFAALAGVSIAFGSAGILDDGEDVAALLGALVALGLVRDIGPLCAALVVIGRAGRVLVPSRERLAAVLLSVPALTALFVLTGIISGHLFAVGALDLDGLRLVAGTREAVSWADIGAGLSKSFLYAALLTVLALARGTPAAGGQSPCGLVDLRPAAESSALILGCDFALSALLI